jgi:hypothetical protein
MHVGLIGDIGPAAAEFYDRNLVRAHAATNCAEVLSLCRSSTRFPRLRRRLSIAGCAVSVYWARAS